ncbi:unnamed protein product [Coregonus sp. 'balchen']|nr:unnamed protein product [Coregonus sp. 'balchen']
MDVVEEHDIQDKPTKKKTKKPKKQPKPQHENGDDSMVEKTDPEHVDAPAEFSFPPTFSVSEIKNKQRRHLMFMKLKQEKRKQKMAMKKKKKKERDALGDKAPPKEVPKTIENQRVYDETTVNPEDEEVAFDEGTDEFSAYFNRLTNPKVLITTSDRPRGRTVRFCNQLATVIPDAHVYYRRGLALKRVIPQCVARGFTYLMVINEDRKRRGKDPTEHSPEVILNNFTTRLGHSMGRLFAALFPHDPQYIFKNEKRVGIQELGPRFTLKLRSLQKGTFDSKFGEYEWVLKRHENDVCRRRFNL